MQDVGLIHSGTDEKKSYRPDCASKDIANANMSVFPESQTCSKAKTSYENNVSTLGGTTLGDPQVLLSRAIFALVPLPP